MSWAYKTWNLKCTFESSYTIETKLGIYYLHKIIRMTSDKFLSYSPFRWFFKDLNMKTYVAYNCPSTGIWFCHEASELISLCKATANVFVLFSWNKGNNYLINNFVNSGSIAIQRKLYLLLLCIIKHKPSILLIASRRYMSQ